MQDHELLEVAGLRTTEPAKKSEGESVAGVADAIRTGRPEGLGTKGLLHLQRAAGNAAASSFVQRQDEESPVHDVIRSPGQALPAETQSFMQDRLGHDFSDVQVHTDGKAAESAKAVQAQAYTVGNHVVFNEGKFDPSSDDGKHRLAHELTHVVQQREGPVDGTPQAGGIQVSDPSDRFEQEAESSAQAALSGGTEAVSAGAAGVQREAAAPEEEMAEDAPVQNMAIQREAAAPEEEMAEDAPVQNMAIQREAESEELEGEGDD